MDVELPALVITIVAILGVCVLMVNAPDKPLPVCPDICRQEVPW